MQAAFLFTVVGTTGFLGVLAGQLPGVNYKRFSLFFCVICMRKHMLGSVCVSSCSLTNSSVRVTFTRKKKE